MTPGDRVDQALCLFRRGRGSLTTAARIECQHPISNRLEPDSEDGFAEGWQSIGRPPGVLSRRYSSIPTTTGAEGNSPDFVPAPPKYPI